MIKDPPVFREKRKSERNALQTKKDRVKDGEHCQNIAESHLILNQPGCGQSSKGSTCIYMCIAEPFGRALQG